MFKKYIFPAFILVCLIQLFVPAKMIWDREAIISEGTPFKFRAAPVDPNDPFRGKYLDVNFEPNEFEVANIEGLSWGETVYLSLTTDTEGYAAIENLHKEIPLSGDFVRVEVSSVINNPEKKSVFIRYPFNRFYMEESKALAAEELYREVLRDSNRIAYALVMVKNGEAVFKDLIIDDVPIQELVHKAD